MFHPSITFTYTYYSASKNLCLKSLDSEIVYLSLCRDNELEPISCKCISITLDWSNLFYFIIIIFLYYLSCIKLLDWRSFKFWTNAILSSSNWRGRLSNCWVERLSSFLWNWAKNLCDRAALPRDSSTAGFCQSHNPIWLWGIKIWW